MEAIEQKVRNILSRNTSNITNALNMRLERVIKEKDFNIIVMEIANLIKDEKKLKSKIDRI